MRYNSISDGQLLRKSSLGPVLSVSRRRYALPIPGRGLSGCGSRTVLRGFGATSVSPPVGAGTGAGAEIGASQGASIGSAIVPGIGTAIGAAIGAIGGAIAGSINKKDPEQYNFDNAVALWQQNPNNIYNIGNKYLPLAGLFDLSLRNPHIPIYLKYGRMGEEHFTRDLAMLVYQAAQNGQITATDTPLTIMNRVVQPWIDSWQLGPLNDPHADMINKLITGLVLDYVTGAGPQIWRARSGDLPASFASIPPFSLPTRSQLPTASPTPSPQPIGGPDTGTVVITPSVVSTTPPAVGAPLSAAMDAATGKMISLPAGATFGGLTADGKWLVVYASGSRAGTYELFNGALTPYTGSSVLPSGQLVGAPSIPIPAGYTITTQSALLGGVTFPLYSDMNGALYVWSGGEMLLYKAAPSIPAAVTSSGGSSGGGGGGFFPGFSTPVTSTPMITPSASIAPQVNDLSGLWLIGGAALGLYLLVGG